MRFLATMCNMDKYLSFLNEEGIKFIKEDVWYCEADTYAEAEQRFLNFLWELKKTDIEYMANVAFDVLADNNYDTEKLIEMFGRSDGAFFQYIHKKYDRIKLYNCDVYFFEAEDKETISEEDKQSFRSLSEKTYIKMFRTYISPMMCIVKAEFESFDKYGKLINYATHI